MRETDWETWREYHSARFGLATASDAKWFASIKRILANATLDELKAATDAISCDPERSREGRNLGLLQREVRAKRLSARRAQADFDDDRAFKYEHQCAQCRGLGVVSAPHPKRIVDGEWVYPFETIALYCRCNVGANKFNKMAEALRELHQKRGGRELFPMSLDEYEARFPDWRELMEDHKAMKADKEVADYHAREAVKEARSVRALLPTIGKAVDDE